MGSPLRFGHWLWARRLILRYRSVEGFAFGRERMSPRVVISVVHVFRHIFPHNSYPPGRGFLFWWPQPLGSVLSFCASGVGNRPRTSFRNECLAVRERNRRVDYSDSNDGMRSSRGRPLSVGSVSFRFPAQFLTAGFMQKSLTVGF